MASGAVDDKMLLRMDAIIGSMTPKERTKPELLNAKRKIRIAKGSGTTVQDVNKLLKMHQEMATAMKKIRKMGGLKGLGRDVRQGRHGRSRRNALGGSGLAACWAAAAACPAWPGRRHAPNLPPGFENLLKKK